MMIMIMVVVEAMTMMIVELHGQRVTVPTGIPQGPVSLPSITVTFRCFRTTRRAQK